MANDAGVENSRALRRLKKGGRVLASSWRRLSPAAVQGHMETFKVWGMGEDEFEWEEAVGRISLAVVPEVGHGRKAKLDDAFLEQLLVFRVQLHVCVVELDEPDVVRVRSAQGGSVDESRVFSSRVVLEDQGLYNGAELLTRP